MESTRIAYLAIFPAKIASMELQLAAWNASKVQID